MKATSDSLATAEAKLTLPVTKCDRGKLMISKILPNENLDLAEIQFEANS